MNFVLSAPRYWIWNASGSSSDGDWLYVAGGADTDGICVYTFEKINVVTGEVVKLKDLRYQPHYCHLIKF